MYILYNFSHPFLIQLFLYTIVIVDCWLHKYIGYLLWKYVLLCVLKYTSILFLLWAVETFYLYQRATHVYGEAKRVLRFKAVCEEQSADALVHLGQLMNESHASCRDLYDCSHPDLDKLVEICKWDALPFFYYRFPFYNIHYYKTSLIKSKNGNFFHANCMKLLNMCQGLRI